MLDEKKKKKRGDLSKNGSMGEKVPATLLSLSGWRAIATGEIMMGGGIKKEPSFLVEPEGGRLPKVRAATVRHV